jgi:hypothetical protein
MIFAARTSGGEFRRIGASHFPAGLAEILKEILDFAARD